MAKIKIKQIDNSTASSGDVITYNGSNNVWAAQTGEANTASNVGAGGVGVFKQKTGVDFEFKNINAASNKITITDDVINDEVDIDVDPSNILTSTLNNDENWAADQNLWETVTADSGSTAANTITDTLTIAGGAGISTSITGDTLTITNDSPNVDQNIWLNVAGDTGSTAANTTTDTLTIAGGTGISTAMSGDTLTITNSSPNVDQNLFATIAVSGQSNVVADSTTDILTLVAGTGMSITTNATTDTITFTNTSPNVNQNLWLNIVGDTGSTAANTTTDTLTIAGGTNVTTSVSGDTITINASNGLSGLTIAQITGYDSQLSEPMLFLTDTTRSSKVLSVEATTLIMDDRALDNGDWLDIGETSDTNVGYLMPYNGTLIRATGETVDGNFTTFNFHLYVNSTDAGTILTISGNSEQTAYNTDLNINFSAGDKLRLKAVRTSGSNIIEDTAITLWIKWRTT